jgi:hypothetical protein
VAERGTPRTATSAAKRIPATRARDSGDAAVTDTDPTAKLGLGDLVAAVGEENMPVVREKAAKRLASLDSLSVATLERAMRRNNAAAAIYVHRTLHARGLDDTVTLPGWTKCKTLAERAAFVDKMLAQGKLSIVQARALLGLGESVQIQKEIEALKQQISTMQVGGKPDESAKSETPKKPVVKRIPPVASEIWD